MLFTSFLFDQKLIWSLEPKDGSSMYLLISFMIIRSTNAMSAKWRNNARHSIPETRGHIGDVKQKLSKILNCLVCNLKKGEKQ